MIFETERLILRPWGEEDAEECFRYAKDPRVGPPSGWPAHTDVENSRQVIRDILAVPETYAVVWKETGLPIGSVGLHFHTDLAEGDDEAELGCWLGAPWWGRDIAPEACREALRHAFEELGLERVWAGYFDGNEKSKRMQEKLGFRYQWTREGVDVPQMGETRRGHVNRMTREEWLTARKTVETCVPRLRDLWFRQLMMADPETMAYNHAWGGTIPFPEDRWEPWYDSWIVRHESRRFYRYLRDGAGRYLGEIAYHYDEESGLWLANVIVYAPYRGRGYGGRGLELLCAAAAENGVDTLWDDIAADNRAVNMFREHGFTEECRTEEKIFLKRKLQTEKRGDR